MRKIITTKIDLSELKYDITCNWLNCGKTPKYIVMSDETRKEVRNSIKPFCQYETPDSGCSKIFGVPVAIWNELKYGEYEVVG